MSLSKNQIAEIKQFINSRGFTHIEVEMEILDHVASGVEDKFEENPKKSITQAIEEVHAGFGVFGFATIEEEKQKYFYTILKNEFLRNLKQIVLFKKPMLNLVLLAITILLMSFLNPANLYAFSYVSLILPFIVMSSVFLKSYKKFRKWKGKSLMLITSASLFYVFLFTSGQWTSTIFRGIAETNIQTGAIFLSFCFYLIMLCAITVSRTVDWGYEWTYERYLKYAN